MNEAAQRTVELAIAAAGVRDDSWAQRVYDNIGEIAVMMKDESEVYEWARRINEASVFKVTYLGFEEEIPDGMQRPSRLIIHTQSDKAINTKPGPRQNLTGEEHVRTDPLWTRPGKLVANRIKQVPKGAEVLIYKYTEVLDGDRKVRVLVHFQVLRTPRPGVSNPPGREQERQESRTRHTAAPDQPPAEVSVAPPEAHSPADNRALSEIEARFMKLSGPDKVAYAQAVREFGITNPICPEPEQLQDALNILDGLEKG